MQKTKVGTYRPSDGIFIEGGDIFVDEKNRIYIKAKYKEYNFATRSGYTTPKTRNRLLQFDPENESFSYKGLTYYVWNRTQIINNLIYHGLYQKGAITS